MSVLSLHAVVGKYRIDKLVGSGGMGEVYRATNLQTRTQVAVKALTQTKSSDTALARFRNEAVIQYNMRHPNVAELYEYFEYQGKPCIVMEFVEGQTLSEWIRESGPLPLAKALEILAEICDAVSYMHSRGTIHRDIKSANIRINAQGEAKLLDFGISVAKDTPAYTRAGYSIGTPEKMAPEQHQGLRGDARSDVWALGVLLYEMVTGAEPFSNLNPTALRQDIMAVRCVPASTRRPGLPKPIGRLISNCLRARPDDRYASAGVLLREVRQVLRDMGVGTRRVVAGGPAIAAACLALVVAGLFIYAFSVGTAFKVPDQDKPESVRGSDSASEIYEPRNAGVPARPAAERRPSPGIESSPITPPPQPIAGVRPSPADAGAEPGPGEKTIRVATYDGRAEVLNRDGRMLGSTPFELTGPFGKSYELWLSRPGFQPRRVDVQINNKNEYLFGLEKLDSTADSGK